MLSPTQNKKTLEEKKRANTHHCILPYRISHDQVPAVRTTPWLLTGGGGGGGLQGEKREENGKIYGEERVTSKDEKIGKKRKRC